MPYVLYFLILVTIWGIAVLFLPEVYSPVRYAVSFLKKLFGRKSSETESEEVSVSPLFPGKGKRDFCLNKIDISQAEDAVFREKED